MKGFLLVAAMLMGACSPAQLKWGHDFEAAKKQAAKSKKLIFIDFHATWCGPCKMMDREVFQSVGGQAVLKNYILVKLDVDREGKDLGRKIGVTSLPTLIVVGTDGKPLLKAEGYLDLPTMKDFLKEANRKAASSKKK